MGYAAGLYCSVTKAEHYLQHIFKPFGDILGPDVDFGIALRQQGLRNYIDYSVDCAHLNGEQVFTLKNSNPVKITFINKSDKGERGDL
jgi:hypothetical protein